jgi:hypothetical protein
MRIASFKELVPPVKKFKLLPADEFPIAKSFPVAYKYAVFAPPITPVLVFPLELIPISIKLVASDAASLLATTSELAAAVPALF